jgi:hypothetical protein
VATGAMMVSRPAKAAESGFVQAIRAQMATLPDGPVLLNSYLVQTGRGQVDFDITQANAAYVYDNALAGLLLLASGHHSDALRIGHALETAQAHDRFYKDGRLRNAYQAGAMTTPAKLPGWWDDKTERWNEDPYQVSSQSGPIAWAMLLWAALGMHAPANAAGDWLDAQLRTSSGYYGGFYGFEPNPVKLIWQSTEQNTDLYTAYKKLGRTEDAAHAKNFVQAMLDVNLGRFNTGTSPTGVTNHLIAADAGIWPSLAGLANLKTAKTAINALQCGAGIGFSSASQSIWLEGTAFAALALGAGPLAAQFMTTIAANTSPDGYVYATVAPMLSTGLTTGPALKPGTPEAPFNYYRRPALSTTAWAGMAVLGYNPLAVTA